MIRIVDCFLFLRTLCFPFWQFFCMQSLAIVLGRMPFSKSLVAENLQLFRSEWYSRWFGISANWDLKNALFGAILEYSPNSPEAINTLDSSITKKYTELFPHLLHWSPITLGTVTFRCFYKSVNVQKIQCKNAYVLRCVYFSHHYLVLIFLSTSKILVTCESRWK